MIYSLWNHEIVTCKPLTIRKILDNDVPPNFIDLMENHQPWGTPSYRQIHGDLSRLSYSRSFCLNSEYISTVMGCKKWTFVTAEIMWNDSIFDWYFEFQSMMLSFEFRYNAPIHRFKRNVWVPARLPACVSRTFLACNRGSQGQNTLGQRGRRCMGIL